MPGLSVQMPSGYQPFEILHKTIMMVSLIVQKYVKCDELKLDKYAYFG